MIDVRPMLQGFFYIRDITSLPAERLLQTEFPGLIPIVPFTQAANRRVMERAGQQIPTYLPKQHVEQLESLLLFFWRYVHEHTAFASCC